MSDLRFDPVTGTWVAIARNRRDRPMEFVPLEKTRQQMICPFCRGNEDETPANIASFNRDGKVMSADDEPSAWTSRVIPNKFPSLADQPNHVVDHSGPYRIVSGNGSQEIIIPSPRHVSSLSELSDVEIRVMMVACQQRMNAKREDHIAHNLLFMNCGLAAGASLGHVHLQLMSSPLTSEYLERRCGLNENHVSETGQPLLKTILDWELKQEIRIVSETDSFVVFCPFASRYAFQTWIVPKKSTTSFSASEEPIALELGELLKRVVRQFESLLDEPAYNFLLHQAPIGRQANDYWYAEIFPRVTLGAGYELGTDIWVNPIAPETAARRLQE